MKTIAIVTGASSGIGKEFFLSLEGKGPFDEIWVIARSKDKLEALQAETQTPVRVFPADLSQNGSFKAVENALQEEKPSVKYLICASGFGRFCSSLEDDTATLENMVDLNCRAIVTATQAVAPYMAKGGIMLLIASVAAFQPIPYIATYGATKAFVLSYGRALNKELQKKYGARVLCVCPFWTKTAFFDRAITAEQTQTVVKKYAAMYTPDQIVKRAWKDAKHKKRDFSICGFTAKSQVLAVKCLPHRLVMWIWMKQQKL